jgi:hypothetical protein
MRLQSPFIFTELNSNNNKANANKKIDKTDDYIEKENAEIKIEKAIVKHLKRLKEIRMHDAAGINLNFHFYSYSALNI